MKIHFPCIASVMLLLGIAVGYAQYPDYDTTGPFTTVSYRTEDIPGVYQTMEDSRIYYPSSGGQVDPGAVPCPIIVFGHGYQMSIDRYYSYAQHLASWGYVVVLPTISNPFPTPEHYTRARSMVDAAFWTAGRDTFAGDIFHQKLDRFNWGFTGHSMGGGLTQLAADTFKLMDTLRATVSLASPQTTPPTHSHHRISPKLIIAGSIDNIAPWNDVRTAYWDSAPAPGTFAVILGANHGYFMDYSYSWENGGTATITRAEQLRIARRHMTAFFQRYMKNDTTDWNYEYCFGDSIYQHPTMDTVEVRYGIVATGESKDRKKYSLSILPNPFVSECRIAGSQCRAGIYNAFGQKVDEIQVPGIWKPRRELNKGIYFIKSQGGAISKIIMLK
jgi:dienelactone hydrolase